MAIVAGLDVGISKSPTVLTIGESRTGQVINLVKYWGDTLDETQLNIEAILKDNEAHGICVDIAGCGQQVADRLTFMDGLIVQPVRMTAATRKNMSAAFLRDVNSGAFRYEGDTDDDEYDSLCLCHLAMQAFGRELLRDKMN